jgi:hypothetical protein
MCITNPTDALLIAHERGDRLRAEAEAERLFPGRSTARRALAASLRRVADRLDPVGLGPRVAPRLETNR